MDFIDRLVLRVLAWPGSKTYYTLPDIRDRMRCITGERTRIFDLGERLSVMHEKGLVFRRHKGLGLTSHWNITEAGRRALLCRSAKDGSRSTDG
jgi:hypothetical protein